MYANIYKNDYWMHNNIYPVFIKATIHMRK